MINWRLDLRLLAFIELFIGILMLIPTTLAYRYQEADALRDSHCYLAIAVFCSTT